MARVIPSRFDEVLQNDELEERENIANENKRRKRRRRKRRRRMVLLGLIIIAVIYALSDYSNIRIVEMNGNAYYSKQQIMSKANISYDMKSILAPSFLIKNRLEEDVLIKHANVHKTWDGIVKIDIEEEKLVGYYNQNGKDYLIIDGEDDVLIKDEGKLANVPYLADLNKEQIANYKKAVNKVAKENIYLISEVSHYETSYNKDMLKLTMQDNHVVFTSYAGLALLDSYKEMLKGLNTDLKCIVFAEETNTMYTEKCE
ncbi:MAG: FtsQ-type POTRA domain-containing protein [Erysipelotrichia bacterium]|nr:FtsQ-type POTRA domain-containing protein [Erysipelotrichia bacterium]NCC54124.1 FtsQ-type POTRA domain-containing protein [Erysipelotrichia bacterium]